MVVRGDDFSAHTPGQRDAETVRQRDAALRFELCDISPELPSGVAANLQAVTHQCGHSSFRRLLAAGPKHLIVHLDQIDDVGVADHDWIVEKSLDGFSPRARRPDRLSPRRRPMCSWSTVGPWRPILAFDLPLLLDGVTLAAERRMLQNAVSGSAHL